MMTLEAWFALAATATALLLVPHPLASLAAAFSTAWGRASAFVTVPASAVAMTLAALVATTVMLAASFYLPAWRGAMSWFGMAFLMLHILYSYQEPRARHGLADNDNLPETRTLRILGHFILQAFAKLRYFLMPAAIIAQFVGNDGPLGQQYLQIVAAFTAASILAALAYALFPRRFASRKTRPRPSGQAPRKPRTLFIARRAVTAGYRRIAA